MAHVEQAPLRIVQLTDPHLRASRHAVLRGVVVYDQLMACVQSVRRLEPDVVLCTGDIADDLSEEAYELFREAVSELGVAVYVVPGNHDDRDRMAEALRGMCQRLPTGEVVFERRLGKWLLLGLDSQIPGEVAGAVEPHVLEWLSERATNDPAVRTLVFVHHPPGSVGSPWMDAVILRNHQQVARALKRVGVKAVFCGHTHFEHHGLAGSTPFYTTPAASFQFDRFQPLVSSREPGLRIIDLYEYHWFTQACIIPRARRPCAP